ncbi:MAG: acyltransferase family protein [Caulobacter sp.]|nr:acyltransferase family protein [Caulobacter sp.]
MVEATGPEPATRGGRLDWLDYCRLLAALSVVAFHYLAMGPKFHKMGSNSDFGLIGDIAEYGYLGVDFFFMISGFVILRSAAGRSADRFAIGRFVRLWPTFLLCATLTAMVLWAFGLPPGLMTWLANLTMVPAYIGVTSLDGAYWSLAYELMFYAAVFLILLIGQGHRLKGIVLAWVAVQAVFALMGYRETLLLGSYFTLFAGGAVLALIHRDGWSWSLALALLVSIGLAMLGAYERAIGIAGSAMKGEIIPLFAATLVGVGFIPFLVFMRRNPVLPLAGLMGGVTYPLYLLHGRIAFTVLTGLALPRVWGMVGVFLAILALAVAVHLVFEKLTTAFWTRMADLVIGAPVRWVAGRLPWQRSPG